MSDHARVLRRRQRGGDESPSRGALEWLGLVGRVDAVRARPGPLNDDAEGLSCTTVAQCLLFPAPLGRDGSGWTVSAHPVGLIDSPAGVSCVSPTACIGVGSVNNDYAPDDPAARTYTIVERYS